MPRPTPNPTVLLRIFAAACCLFLASWVLVAEEEIPPAPPQGDDWTTTGFHTESAPWHRTPGRLAFWKRLPSGLFEKLACAERAGPSPDRTGVIGWLTRAREGAFRSHYGLLGDVTPSSLRRSESSSDDGALRFRYRWDGEGEGRRVEVVPRHARLDDDHAGVGLRGGRAADLIVRSADATGKSRFFRFSDLGELEKPVGEWNRFEVVSVGGRIDVSVNDVMFRLAEDVSGRGNLAGIAADGEAIGVGRAKVRVIDYEFEALVITPASADRAGDQNEQPPDSAAGDALLLIVRSVAEVRPRPAPAYVDDIWQLLDKTCGGSEGLYFVWHASAGGSGDTGQAERIPPLGAVPADTGGRFQGIEECPSGNVPDDARIGDVAPEWRWRFRTRPFGMQAKEDDRGLE